METIEKIRIGKEELTVKLNGPHYPIVLSTENESHYFLKEKEGDSQGNLFYDGYDKKKPETFKYTVIYSVPVNTGSCTSYITQIEKFETDNIKEKIKEYDIVQNLFEGWINEVTDVQF